MLVREFNKFVWSRVVRIQKVLDFCYIVPGNKGRILRYADIGTELEASRCLSLPN